MKSKKKKSGEKMEIPILDLKGQYHSIRKEVDEVLERVVNSQYFILSGSNGAVSQLGLV